MKSKEFLKDRLFQIYLVLKNINIKYQYLNESKIHLVEITPMSEFVHNKEYISMEKELVADFKRNFSSSKLVFVSENSLIRVKSAEFSYIREKGKNLIENRSFKNYSPFFSLTVTRDPQNFRRL
jgi:hypothetical protein